jgi:hypothetical protein
MINPRRGAMRGRMMWILAVVFGLWQAAAWAKEAAPLDGKTFDVQTGEPGKKMEPDQMVFSAGTFRSTHCDQWGFGKATYTAKTAGGETTFNATTTSAKEGKIVWTGKVKDKKIEGSYVWEKAGQAPIKYVFSGSTK